MSTYLYVNISGNPLHVRSTSFGVGGQKEFKESQEQLDKLLGFQLDRYIDGILDNDPTDSNDSAQGGVSLVLNASRDGLRTPGGEILPLANSRGSVAVLSRTAAGKVASYRAYGITYVLTYNSFGQIASYTANGGPSVTLNYSVDNYLQGV